MRTKTRLLKEMRKFIISTVQEITRENDSLLV